MSFSSSLYLIGYLLNCLYYNTYLYVCQQSFTYFYVLLYIKEEALPVTREGFGLPAPHLQCGHIEQVYIFIIQLINNALQILFHFCPSLLGTPAVGLYVSVPHLCPNRAPLPAYYRTTVCIIKDFSLTVNRVSANIE